MVTASEAGLANRSIPDDIILAFATRLGRSVLTLDWEDFLQLHDGGTRHAGIVACEVNVDTDALAVRVNTAIAGLAALDDRFIEVRK